MASKTNQSIVLSGSERPRPNHHQHIGPADPDTPIAITIVVRRRPGSPPLPDLEYWHNTPIQERRAISRAAYAQVYGAASDDLDAVNAFATAHGLRVLDSHAGRRCVIVEGSRAQLETAFGITLQHYRANQDTYRGYDGPVQVPNDLAGVVEAVIGLDNRPRCIRATNDPSTDLADMLLLVPQIAQAYHFPNTGAADQTIGVFGGNGAYISGDILDSKTGYFAQLKSGDWLAYSKTPTIKEVDMVVGGMTYRNEPTTNSDIGELTLDICACATVAQGCTVNVYFAGNFEQSWIAFLNRVLQPENEQAPTVLTSSWFFDIDDSTATASGVGDASNPATPAGQIHGLFQSLAVAGVPIFYAQGDCGADNWAPLTEDTVDNRTVPDGKSHVAYPGTDPWVTSCGGTVVAVDSANARTAEVVWHDAWGAGNFGAPNYYDSKTQNPQTNWGTTGGGISAQFEIPPYQSSIGFAGVYPTVDTGTSALVSGRGVPDVAGHVAYTGFVENGTPGLNQAGTSAVAPLYAGLYAVLRSTLGREFGPFNEALYALADVAFNDITEGNNSSDDTPANVMLAFQGATNPPQQSSLSPNAPYFTAAQGWDPCTGLGSIDGTKLLNALIAQLYPPTKPNYYFLVQQGSFGKDAVQLNVGYAGAVSLILEGYTPKAAKAFGLPSVQTSAPSVKVVSGQPSDESAQLTTTPQRIIYPCTVTFSSDGVFPASGAQPTTVTLSSHAPPDSNLPQATADLELDGGDVPFFDNYDSAGTNAWYYSNDLRVFTVTPAINATPLYGIKLGADAAGTSWNGQGEPAWDTSAAYGYMQALLNELNSVGAEPSTDVFAGFPGQGTALDTMSSVTPFYSDPSQPYATTSPNYQNYTFAVARVRVTGTKNTTTPDDVRVLFRLFTGVTSDTDYATRTYPNDTLDSQQQPLSPGVGHTGIGSLYFTPATIPMFATGNYSSSPVNDDYPQFPLFTSINDQPVKIGSSGESYAYYGCYVNIYDPTNLIGSKPINSQLWGTHHCIVAQLVYDGAPMPTAAGVLQGPEYSSNFAQRNVQVTLSDNPGPPDTHRVPQAFDTRPSAALGDGPLQNYPDELMIDWGNTPVGARAQIYWPQVDSAAVLALAQTLYTTHQLSAVDAHTVGCAVPEGYTFLPIPPGTDDSYAGLFTVDLGPQTVTVGQELMITVRRLATRNPPPALQPGPPTHSDEALRPPELLTNWRYVVGSFAVQIPVTTARVMLPSDENTLAIMNWRLTQMDPGNRWTPVLDRYIGYLKKRVDGLGGDSGAIVASPWGVSSQSIHHRCERTGKIEDLMYDRFGDFEGFRLRTEHGQWNTYLCHEHAIEALIYRAWQDRSVVTVCSRTTQPHDPIEITLRSGRQLTN